MDTLPDFLSCTQSLSVISFHIFTKPHPHPLHCLSSLGSGRDPPAADGFTVRQRDSEFLKKGKQREAKQQQTRLCLYPEACDFVSVHVPQ